MRTLWLAVSWNFGWKSRTNLPRKRVSPTDSQLGKWLNSQAYSVGDIPVVYHCELLFVVQTERTFQSCATVSATSPGDLGDNKYCVLGCVFVFTPPGQRSRRRCWTVYTPLTYHVSRELVCFKVARRALAPIKPEKHYPRARGHVTKCSSGWKTVQSRRCGWNSGRENCFKETCNRTRRRRHPARHINRPESTVTAANTGRHKHSLQLTSFPQIMSKSLASWFDVSTYIYFRSSQTGKGTIIRRGFVTYITYIYMYCLSLTRKTICNDVFLKVVYSWIIQKRSKSKETS